MIYNNRIVAFLIDVILLSLFGIITIIPLLFILDSSEQMIIIPFVSSLEELLFFFKDVLNPSIGKRIMKQKIVCDDGTEPKFLKLLLRNISLFIWPIDAIMVLRRTKRLGEIITKTHVEASVCSQDKASVKLKLDNLIQQYKVQPVGDGYLDCIITENITEFIDELTNLGIKVVNISWWEHNTGENVSIHGHGGLKSTYYSGWFSEMCHVPLTETHGNNEYTKKYISEDVKFEKFYAENVVPGLWLKVPKIK